MPVQKKKNQLPRRKGQSFTAKEVWDQWGHGEGCTPVNGIVIPVKNMVQEYMKDDGNLFWRRNHLWQLIERKIQENLRLSRELATTLALGRLYRWHAELYTVENCGGEVVKSVTGARRAFRTSSVLSPRRGRGLFLSVTNFCRLCVV